MSSERAPLVPAGVDLRDFAFLPLEGRRLLTSDTWILGTSEQRCAAIALWIEAWYQVPAASLPDNDRALAHLSQAGARWPKVRAHALRGWIKATDGRLYHGVLAEKALDAWARKQAQRDRTAAARSARQQLRQSHAATAIATESVTDSVTASKGQGQGQGNKGPSADRSRDTAMPQGLEDAWLALPKRAGNNPRGRARRAYLTRLREGCAPGAMLDGARRYAKFCDATAKTGTEFVMQGATFFGPERPFLEPWTVANGSAPWWATNESILAKALELGISTRGESTEALRALIRQKLSGEHAPTRQPIVDPAPIGIIQ